MDHGTRSSKLESRRWETLSKWIFKLVCRLDDDDLLQFLQIKAKSWDFPEATSFSANGLGRLLLAYLNELGDFSRAKPATSSELISVPVALGHWPLALHASFDLHFVAALQWAVNLQATACQSKLFTRSGPGKFDSLPPFSQQKTQSSPEEAEKLWGLHIIKSARWVLNTLSRYFPCQILFVLLFFGRFPAHTPHTQCRVLAFVFLSPVCSYMSRIANCAYDACAKRQVARWETRNKVAKWHEKGITNKNKKNKERVADWKWKGSSCPFVPPVLLPGYCYLMPSLMPTHTAWQANT